MESRCPICSERAKLSVGFFKPKGWIKYKAPDGNVVYFSSKVCMEKFIFPAKLKEERQSKTSGKVKD